MNFKVGDKVRVRTDLKAGDWYGGWCFSDSMDEFKGKSVIIKKCCVDSYKIDKDEDSYNWSDEMLESIQEVFTFQEVIARIKPNETYESTMSCYKVRSIHMNRCNEIQIRYIEDKTNPTPLLDNTVYIDSKQKFRLKETKKSFTIYYIEHKPNEKQYKFISNERLNINDFVICDTKFGRAYGKVVSYEEEMLTEKESTQLKKCWKA
ncbi:hypothetical protein EXM90_18905 [Clostridium botulinum]|uniref:hypothetical protein n=1 Tax=Clostridium botulinum TaxID=1491 RepID=UPI0007747A6E|nr:hypothetical protein [Clostridium botulinum]MBN3367066.1 hypothetical protein [Clostridium botulinum]MBN3371702.1 hypothetical protein [Clostridium botulinum]MBN3375492.1 hypothetical protein [Clostridium botulinum]MBN3384401.1 hypothetical protein [Clostridium botulinum]MBN3437941.1 hypothetical protein [Clostridium botulinum]